MTKRHRWGHGLRQKCLNAGCGWRRTLKAGRHGHSASVMLYAVAVFDAEVHPVATIEQRSAPPCEGTR